MSLPDLIFRSNLADTAEVDMYNGYDGLDEITNPGETHIDLLCRCVVNFGPLMFRRDGAGPRPGMTQQGYRTACYAYSVHDCQAKAAFGMPW